MAEAEQGSSSEDDDDLSMADFDYEADSVGDEGEDEITFSDCFRLYMIINRQVLLHCHLFIMQIKEVPQKMMIYRWQRQIKSVLQRMKMMMKKKEASEATVQCLRTTHAQYHSTRIN